MILIPIFVVGYYFICSYEATISYNQWTGEKIESEEAQNEYIINAMSIMMQFVMLCLYGNYTYQTDFSI